MTDKKLLICPNCGRQNVRIRFKEGVWVCNVCGTTWPYKDSNPKDRPVKSPKQTPQDHPAHPNQPGKGV